MLHFCFRAAFKCWSQALDDIFRKQDVLHTWKEFGSSLTNATDSCSPPGSKDYGEEFLSKAGIWGCLQGAVISAKIAQWVWRWSGLCSSCLLPLWAAHLCHAGCHTSHTLRSRAAMSISYRLIQFTICAVSCLWPSPLPVNTCHTWNVRTTWA